VAAACALLSEAAPLLQLPQQEQQRQWSPQDCTYLVGLRLEPESTADRNMPTRQAGHRRAANTPPAAQQKQQLLVASLQHRQAQTDLAVFIHINALKNA
jgi:hypothetical protein